MNIENNKTVPVNLDSVLYYRKKSYNIQQFISNKKLKNALVIDASLLGTFYLNKGQLDSAKHYFEASNALAEKLKLLKLSIESFLGLGQIYTKRNETDSALLYYKTALKIAQKGKRVGNIKASYRLIAQLYEKLGDKDNAKNYASMYAAITDSIAAANKVSSQVTAEIILAEKETHHEKSRMTYVTLIVAAIIAVIASILAFFHLRNKHSNSVKTHQQEKTLLNRKFEELQVDKLSEDVLKEINNLVKDNDPSFYAKFKEHHPVFIYKLTKHSPDILSSDLDLCAKLKLGFNTKEIAYFSKTSLRAVESRKYRIRKKIGLSTDDDLATWIVNL